MPWIYPEDGGPLIQRFDAIETEEHTAELELTDHAVEAGTDITDHVREKNAEYTFAGVISNTPIYPDMMKGRGRLATVTGAIPRYFPPISAIGPGYLTRIANDITLTGLFGPPIVSAQMLVFQDWFDAIREAWETLTKLQTDRTLVRIVTTVREYDHMVLQSLHYPRAAADDSCATFNMHFRQLRIVESGTVVAPPVPAEPRGANEKDKGGQGKKELGPELKSIFAGWLGL